MSYDRKVATGINRSRILFQIFFNSTQQAFEAAKRGKVTSYIFLSHNFTESLEDIRDEGRFADDSSFAGREIQIHMDMTDQQIAFFLERKFRSAYQSFSEKMMVDCGLPMRLGNLPMYFLEPIFGQFEAEYKEFIAPGIVMT